MSRRAPLFLISVVLFVLALGSLLVFVASASGHPPSTDFGATILPISLGCGLLFPILSLIALVGAFDQWKRK